jgi:HAD superfamily hydrolase (TIGR01549 family)
MEKLLPFKSNSEEVIEYLKNRKPRLSKVIFDLDGTILDQEKYVINRLFSALVSDLRFPSTIIEDLENQVDMFGLNKIIDRIIDLNSLSSDIGKSILLHSLRDPNYLDDPSIIRGGTKSLFDSLKIDLKVVFCTNGNKLQQRNKSNLLARELNYQITTIYCADSESKPSRICLENAIGSSIKDECIFIGDSEIDLEAAKNAEIEFIHVSELLDEN